MPLSNQFIAREVKKEKPSIVFIIVSIIFAIYCLFIIYPFIYSLILSIAKDDASFDTMFYLFKLIPIPSKISFASFAEAWNGLEVRENNFFMMLLNSIWYAGGMTVVGLFYATVSAYVVSKYRFPGRKFIYAFALLMMMVPILGGTASNLKFTAALGGYNSPFYVILNAQTINGSFIILCATFSSISWNYAESAFIDGAGHFRTFFKVMLPQAIGPISALALMDFIANWADSETSLIYFPDLPTLGTGLYMASSYFMKTASIPASMAAMIMCCIPSVVLFAIFSKKILSINFGGGIKG